MNEKPVDPDQLKAMLRSLARIRKVELKIEELYHLDEMKTPVHLSLGQEAVAVGVCAHLKKDDYVFSNHRSHAHYLAKGGDLKAMMAELYNRETGCARGRGGSMHLVDTSVGMYGSSAIVAGGIPHAVGAAFASAYNKEGKISISFFGDAACEQGVFYESMNWAALKKLPVVFVCEHNLYAVYSHVSARQVNDSLAMRPRAFDIPALVVDGMDLMDVYNKSQEAIDHVRSGKGPFFLECNVQRWRGHAGSGDPLKETYRRPEELEEGYHRDTVDQYEEYLCDKNIMTKDGINEMYATLDQEIDEAFKYAQQSPFPEREDLEKYLFAD